jgi:hypothetical protein
MFVLFSVLEALKLHGGNGKLRETLKIPSTLLQQIANWFDLF